MADAWSMLERFPSSFLVAELTRTNAWPLLERMGELERSYPLARVAVVAERSLAGYEWLVREAGAVWYAVSTRELGPIVAIALRHLQLAPVPQGDVVQRIYSSLPWGPAPE